MSIKLGITFRLNLMYTGPLLAASRLLEVDIVADTGASCLGLGEVQWYKQRVPIILSEAGVS